MPCGIQESPCLCHPEKTARCWERMIPANGFPVLSCFQVHSPAWPESRYPGWKGRCFPGCGQLLALPFFLSYWGFNIPDKRSAAITSYIRRRLILNGKGLQEDLPKLNVPVGSFVGVVFKIILKVHQYRAEFRIDHVFEVFDIVFGMVKLGIHIRQ